jgi:chromate reductase
MSASTGRLGGARAQYHLRQVFVFLNMYPMNKPEVFVPHAQEKIDDTGRVTDEETRQVVLKFLQSFVRWVRKSKKRDRV